MLTGTFLPWPVLTRVTKRFKISDQTYVLSHSFSIPTDTGLSVGNYYDADGNKINNSQDILNYLGSGWSLKDLVNSKFNSQENSIGLVSANSMGNFGFVCVEVGDKKIFAKVVENQTIYSFFKTGDVILVTETDVPDRWIDGSNAYKLETTKVDLTPYAKTSDIPTVNNATLTIQKNGTNVATFTANSSTNQTANITVPTKVSELTNDSGYLTSHQDISGKVSKSGDTMSGNLNPETNKGASLGTSSLYWNNIYGTTIYENGTSLSSKYASLSNAITSVTWTDTAGELNFKNSAGTTKSTVALPIKHYFGTTYGECYTIDAPNAEYSMQIGESGFTVDSEIPGYDQVSNILQVNSTTFTYKGNVVLHKGNATSMASFYSHSGSKYVDIRTNQGPSTTNGVVIIATGTINLAGETTISLTHSMPNTNYALFFTQVNSSTSAKTTYVPIIRSKGTSNFKVFIGSGGVTYNYVAIYVG